MDDTMTYLPGDRLFVGYGFDPGLRHGALVRSVFHFSEYRNFTRLREVQVCFRWGKFSSLSLTKSSPYEAYQRLGGQVINSIDGDPGTPIAVDWDQSSIYWSKTGIQLVQQAYLLGYITRGWQMKGHPIIMMQPSEVRAAFGLKPRSQKSDVWEAFKERVHVDDAFESQLTDVYQDTVDAVILSYFVADAQKKLDDTHHDQQSTQASILSK